MTAGDMTRVNGGMIIGVKPMISSHLCRKLLIILQNTIIQNNWNCFNRCHLDVLKLAFVQAFSDVERCVTMYLQQLCSIKSIQIRVCSRFSLTK